MSYKLSATLAAHSADVRAVASPTNDLILSASRDATAISWTRSSSSSSFQQTTTLRPGSGYVNAVTYMLPSPDAPQGYVVTAGQDMVINVFPLGSPSKDPAFTLIGHEQNICALHTGPDGTLISGSWDSTAKVWKDFKLAYDLKGHAQSVLAVVAVDGQKFLTASADKTIKMWRQHKAVNTFAGHKDAVRGLALVTDIGFASCSNDSEIHVWTLEGDLVYSLSGHTSFVYGLSIIPNGDIISCGEDRTVRIWRDGECIQTITHPAVSIWAITSMPNGDIASGCSDHTVRVFSRAEDRWLPAPDLKAFDDEVASQAIPAHQVGDVKTSDLPGPEALLQPGRKAGETKMVKNGDIVEAHQWDSASSSWTKIGTVVDAVGSGRKQLYQGKEYDYVFDVDIQDGVPPLKLPYNVTENPWSAAQRFLEANELPSTYADEVVRFIEKNTAGVTIGTGGETYNDPFTGASRYQPSSNSVPMTGGGGGDPFTGASRYQPSNSSVPMTGGGGGVDPFTGASRYQPTPPTPSSGGSSNFSDPYTGAARYQPAAAAESPYVTPMAPPSAHKSIPHKTPITFKQCNIPAMRNKLTELNTEVQKEISISHLALFPEEIALFTEVFDYLEAITSRRQDVSGVAPPRAEHLEAIISVLDRWPAIHRYPVMDLVRLIAAYCPEPLNEPSLRQRFLAALLKASDWDENWTSPMSKAKERNLVLLFRATANAFQDNTLVGDNPWVLDIFAQMNSAPYELFTPTQRIVGATVMLNFSCVTLNDAPSPELRAMHLQIVLNAINFQPNDNETTYRGMIALGNVLYAAKKWNQPLNADDVAKVRATVAFVETTSYIKPGQSQSDAAVEKARATSVGREILGLL